MDQNENPYRAPCYELSEDLSIWNRIKRALFGQAEIRERFLGGEPIIHYGVMFFVQPDDGATIHAAIPLSSPRPDLIELAVMEAQRELWKLLQSYDELSDDIKDRQLAIRFIVNYQNVNDQLCEPVVADWFNLTIEDSTLKEN